MRSRRTTGSALAMVVITASVLFLLTGIVYAYFKMNTRSAMFEMNRIRAEVAAEAGVALSLHYLASMELMPENTDPFPLLAPNDSLGWIILEHTGRTMAVIDPVNGITGGLRNGAVQIRSVGVSGDQTVTIFAGAAPSYPSSYALATDMGIPQGFFIDGRVVNGPVHSNGSIAFSSYSADSTGDPYVEMISTTSEGGFEFIGFGRSNVPHPSSSNIWVQPYGNHRNGIPYWQPYGFPMDFQRVRDHFSAIVSGSSAPSAERITAERIIIEGDRIAYKQNQQDPERYLNLTGVNIVIVRNGFSPVMVKSSSIPDHPITIVSQGDMKIYGGIDGGAAGSGGPLGLVSMGDFIIAADPDLYQQSDWAGRWKVETDGGLLLRACLLAPWGSLRAEVPYLPRDQTRITVSGSLLEESMGRLSSGNSGYELGISWDQGLMAMHPPNFPLLGRWNVYSWMQDSGVQEQDITADQL